MPGSWVRRYGDSLSHVPDATAYFVADDADTVGLASALDALAQRFSVEQSVARSLLRTWLDTDDWLLHKAGMVLEQRESTTDGLRLIVRRAEGREHTQPVEVITLSLIHISEPTRPY